MSEYCFFTIEHPKAKRVYVRGLMNITEPIDDYDKIVRYGVYMSKELPTNPFKKEEKEHKLYNELISSIKTHFEDICDELVFAKTIDEANEWDNNSHYDDYNLDYEKVII